MLRSARRTRRLVGLASMVVLLGAVLPNVLFVGHLPVPLLAVQGAQAPTPSEVQEHVAHCHYGPGMCTDDPHLQALSWWLPGGGGLAIPSGALSIAAAGDTLVVLQVFLSPPEKPPQSL